MGAPFLPLDYQQHTRQAESMRVFACMMLVALPALADWAVRYRSGEEALRRNRPETAIQELRAALAERSQEPAILDALGRAEFQAGNYRSAKKYFDRAVQRSVDGKAAVLTNSAMASIALGETRRAESLARQALELEPQNVKVLKVLAQALYLQKLHTEAKTTLHRILVIESDPVTRADLATLYQADGRRDKAMDLLQQAVAETAPSQARARMVSNLGLLQWESGMRDASEKTLREALKEAEASVGPDHPDTARILEQHSEVLRRIGRKAEAKNAAERAVQIRASTASQTNENGFTVDWRDARDR